MLTLIKTMMNEFRVGANVLYWTWKQCRQGANMKGYPEEPKHRKGCKIALAIALVFLAVVLFAEVFR